MSTTAASASPSPSPLAASTAAGPSPRRIIARRFGRHRLAVLGASIVLVLGIIAVLADVLAPHDPAAIDFLSMRAAPSAVHPLGTDAIGRDVLSRLIYASRVSLSVGIVAVSIYVTIGTVLGAIAGYYSGWVDHVLMRITDMVLSFPTLMLILVVVSLVGPGIYNIMIVLGLLGWPTTARIVRAQFLWLREQDFVLAGRTIGASNARLIFLHILPNTVGPIVVAATFGVAAAILSEAALSFLGLGVQPPQASWGNLLADAQSLTILEQMPWLWVPPGLMIFISVLSINFVGDGLRDAFDPRMKV